MMFELLLHVITWARKTPIAFLSTTVTFLALILSVVGASQFLSERTNITTSYRRDLLIEAAIRDIRNDLDMLIEDARQPTDVSLPATTPDASTSITDLEASVIVLQEEIKRFHAMLLSDPALLVTLPLIKQNVDMLQGADVQIQNRLGELADAVNRANALTQWFIGVFFTLILGVFGILLTEWRKKNAEGV